MLFEFNNDARLFNEEILRRRQCSACPLKHCNPPNIPKGQYDILIISDKSYGRIDSQDTGYKTYHTDLVECIGLTQEADKATHLCCTGRKASMVLELKPKIVVAMGPEIYNELEKLFGYKAPKIRPFNCPLPTRYEGHDFWLLPVSDFATPGTFIEIRKLIDRLIQSPPVVHKPSFDNIVFVTRNEDIDPAFDHLERMAPQLSHDIETTCLEPYLTNAAILSFALGSFRDTVYAFPFLHPQTPKDFDRKKVVERFLRLIKLVTLYAHNLKFELTWWAHFLGQFLIYEGKWGDTMALAHITAMDLPKSLDFNIRRYLGFNLKVLSDIDVENLISEPLEKVLQYNALDVKYTDLLREILTPVVVEAQQEEIYQHQLEATRAAVLMELKGLLPNHAFVAEQYPIWKDKLAKHIGEFEQLKEVIVCKERFGKCDPLSNKDIQRLFEAFIGCPQGQKKFDEEFLSGIKHPVGEILLNLREANKLFSTYISPLNQNGTEPNAGKYIMPDGRVHTHFNINLTKTGRLSSDSPNLQNFTSRDGKKYLRNVLMADSGCLFVAIDYAQIEYRIIATLSNDPELIRCINEGEDAHMFWALELLKDWNGKFVVDTSIKDCKKIDKKCVGKNDKGQYCCIKSFRGDVKNCWTFPLCYGASAGKIGRLLNITDQNKLQKILKRFWEKHAGVKRWQEGLAKFYTDNGYVLNAFGRRYQMDLTHNQKINFGVQGTASDVVVRAMCRLARRAYNEDIMALCPNINIHDDLSFIIPEDQFPNLLPIIIREMLDVSEYHWLKVPLGIEVSAGPSWGSLTPVGDFFSNEIAR